MRASIIFKYVSLVILGLTLSFALCGAAWLLAGGNLYAEPCHSLFWC